MTNLAYFELRNRQNVRIQTIETIPELIELQKEFNHKQSYRRTDFPDDFSLEGFEYLQPTLPADNIAAIENGNDMNRIIVASLPNEPLAAVQKVHWYNIEPCDAPYYYFAALDVNKSHRGIGLASSVLEYLNSSSFLKGNVMQISPFSDYGSRYLLPAMRKHLKAENYLLTYDDLHVPAFTKPGFYGKEGFTDKETFFEELSHLRL